MSGGREAGGLTCLHPGGLELTDRLLAAAGLARALPFPDASFDAVLCECVLSTLSDPAAARGRHLRCFISIARHRL